MRWQKTLDIQFGNRHVLAPNILQGVDFYPYSAIIPISVLAPYGTPAPSLINVHHLRTTLTPTLSTICNFVFVELAGPTNTTEAVDFSFAPKNTPEALTLFAGMGDQSTMAIPRIWLGQQFIYTPAAKLLAFGRATVYNHSCYITPNGILISAFGKQKLENSQRFIGAYGFIATNIVYTCNIKNKNVTISAGNLNDGSVSKPHINLALQFIKPDGISNTYGQAWLSHYLRYLLGRGSDFAMVGHHWVSHIIRFVSPQEIYGDKYGKDFASNHAIGGTQTIYPDGYIATQWLTRIIPEIQTIGIEKGIAGEFGAPTINNHTQYLNPAGFGYNDNALYSERFGKLQIYNLRQYISQYFIQNSGLTPQILDPDDPTSVSDFGIWTSIVNKNRAIATFGIDNLKFGYHALENKARVIMPEAITGGIGESLIAYRIRRLLLDGIESPHFSYWHVIRNGARVIVPKGVDGLQIGHIEIINTRRYLPWIVGFISEQFSTPLIADRIRTLDIEWRHSIAPETIPLPTVQLYTRYISPKGFERINEWRPNFGRAELMERFNIIKTAGRNAELFGTEVIVHNKTPEYKVFGHNSGEFGTPMVRHQFRHMPVEGYQTTIIGRHKIADRTQKLTLSGFNAGVIPNLHQIRRLNSPPYSMQYVDLNHYESTGTPADVGYGIVIPIGQVSRPILHSNNLLPEGEAMTRIGQTAVRTNVIYAPNNLVIKNVGLHRIWVKQQFLSPKVINPADGYGKPRFSPHTIYAPSSDMATPQAVRNHYDVSGYRIDQNKPYFGRATVSNQHRSIYQGYISSNGIMSLYGMPKIDLKDKIIAPLGFRGGYIGWHSIPFVPQTIDQTNNGFIGSNFGSCHVGCLFADTIQYISGIGIASENVGKHDISHFHRRIHHRGVQMAQMGISRSNDNPFMWQGLRIGERVLGNYGGFDSNVFGRTWISNKIREINVEGFDSFISEADIRSFNGRLTVKRVIDGMPKKSKKAQIIGVVGINPSLVRTTLNNNQIPNPDIKNKVHYVRPDGNSEQYRKGAW